MGTDGAGMEECMFKLKDEIINGHVLIELNDGKLEHELGIIRNYIISDNQKNTMAYYNSK